MQLNDLNVPLQLLELHGCSSRSLPLQGFPPYFGSLQVRDLDLLPSPHVAEQSVQLVQTRHVPLSKKTKDYKLFIISAYAILPNIIPVHTIIWNMFLFMFLTLTVYPNAHVTEHFDQFVQTPHLTSTRNGVNIIRCVLKYPFFYIFPKVLPA